MQTLSPLDATLTKKTGGALPSHRVQWTDRGRLVDFLHAGLCSADVLRFLGVFWRRGRNVRISRADVERVAELAYLDLSDTELESYRKQIDEILEYIGKLDELDTSQVEPMAQVLAEGQTADATLRDDLIAPCEVAEQILRQAPDPDPPYFRVPMVIER